jgi:hypothetical protein
MAKLLRDSISTGLRLQLLAAKTNNGTASRYLSAQARCSRRSCVAFSCQTDAGEERPAAAFLDESPIAGGGWRTLGSDDWFWGLGELLCVGDDRAQVGFYSYSFVPLSLT